MRFNSLKSRILLLTTIPLTVLLAVFLLTTLHTADDTVRANIERSLVDAGSVFTKLLETRQAELLTMALVSGRDPRFFASFTIPESERSAEFGPTVHGVAEDFMRITGADFIEIFDAHGERIALTGREIPQGLQPEGPLPVSVQRALQGRPVNNVTRFGEHLVVTAVVPVLVANRIQAVLRIGNVFDEEFVEEVDRLTGASVALMVGESVVASSFPPAASGGDIDWHAARRASTPAPTDEASASFQVRHGEVDYLATEVHIPSLDNKAHVHAYLGRELAAELQPMVQLSRKLAVAGAAALVLILALAWTVARRITRPLSSVVEAARAIQRGDYEQPLPSSGADEVAFLARSFDEMRRDLALHMKRLRNLDQMKSNFITLAGHELRTPLTVITSFNEMILSGEMGKIPESMQEATLLIQDRLSDLNRKVTNILQISQFEEGLAVLHRQPLEINQLVDELVAGRRKLLQERSLCIEVELAEDALWVEADPDYLMRAFEQLLDNAIRFTPDGGRVSLEVGQSEQQVWISLRDTGIGIDPQQQRWIFEKAWETSDLMHHTSGHLEFGSRGLGIGLALARHIIDAHQGSITVDSQPGQGSCFRVSLVRSRGSMVPQTSALATA